MNTGKPFKANEYDNDVEHYEYYSEDEELYGYESDSDLEDEEGGIGSSTQVIHTQHLPAVLTYNSRTVEDIREYCASPYVSLVTTQPVMLKCLTNYSQSGMAYYTSEKYECLAIYNPHISAMHIQYQAKPPLVTVNRQRNIITGDIPHCISIQLTPYGTLYVLIIYPDDSECNKMLIYFPHCATAIMSTFVDKSALAEHSLDNLQITGFSEARFNNNFIYVNDCESRGGSLLAEVIEFRKLKHIFNS
jgi:hypothetical protein